MVKNKLRWMAALGGFGVLALPLLASADTQNSTVEVTVNPVIYSFTTSGTVTIGALTPDATGKQSIKSDSVSASTNDSAGMTLTLKDADTTYTLVSGSDSIAKGAGTPAASATLANGEWGWRVDSLAGTDFGAGPTSEVNNGAPSALKFAGIPLNGSPFTLADTSAEGTSAVTVWYSARVTQTQPSGTYSDTVTYTATTK